MPQACASASMMMTPGIIGRCGKCPWKKGSLIGDVLEGADALAGHAFEHPIHQQERVAVRQALHDARECRVGAEHSSVSILLLCFVLAAFQAPHALGQRIEPLEPSDHAPPAPHWSTGMPLE